MSKRTLRTFRREFFTKRQPGKFQNEHCENRSFVCFSRTYFSKHACVVVLCALRASCCCRHRCSHRHGKFARERKQDLKQNWCCFVKAVVHDTACAHDMSHDPAQVHSEVGWGGAEGAQAPCRAVWQSKGRAPVQWPGLSQVATNMCEPWGCCPPTGGQHRLCPFCFLERPRLPPCRKRGRHTNGSATAQQQMPRATAITTRNADTNRICSLQRCA